MIRALVPVVFLLLVVASARTATSQNGSNLTQRQEDFSSDPNWDGHNNRSQVPAPRSVRQDFGYSHTSHAGGEAGEIGGFISPAAEPAYYAQKIPTKSFDDSLFASGKLAVATAGNLDDGAGNTLIGFFNANTINEWRTPNTIAFRVNGRGEVFHAHLEYCTSKWRAGGDFIGAVDPAKGKKAIRGIASRGSVHTWSLRYEPNGNGGGGTVALTLDGETVTQSLAPGHKSDGATFNRCGLLNVMKSADRGGGLWLDDLIINGERHDFATDPRWEGRNNRRTYTADNVRPRFNFGYSPTNLAGGKAAGEIGGLIFRGDERFPERMAYYGDRLELLTLEKPLKAAGQVSLRRGVTDSTVLIGFFHHADSMVVSNAQRSGLPENFLGVAIEGPSREGFLFYPAYGLRDDSLGVTLKGEARPPHIYPNGEPHGWTLEYVPDDNGRITVTLDGKATTLNLAAGHKAIGAGFDRFGFITTHIDGNGQHVYLDDLRYTWRQK